MVKTRLWETMEEDIVSSVNPLFLSLFYESLQENEENEESEKEEICGKTPREPSLTIFPKTA